MSSSATPSSPTKASRPAGHLEACMSAERKKRKMGGALPTIPAISLTPMFGDDEEAKAAVAQQWDRACREVGFIKVVDHGVAREVIEACWKATEELFDQPLAEKETCPMTDDYPYGYTAMGKENLLASLEKEAIKETAGDLKEMFNVCFGSPTPASDMPAVRWPELTDASLLKKVQATYAEYYSALASLAYSSSVYCA